MTRPRDVALVVVGALLLLALGYVLRPRLVSEGWETRQFPTGRPIWACTLVTTRNPWRQDDPRCPWSRP